jgi:hypothetical protein
MATKNRLMSSIKDKMIDKMNLDREKEASQKVCKIKDPSCVYHACMSEHCQKEEVLKHTKCFGKGNCE